MESPICHFIEGYRGKIQRLSAWLTNLTPGCNPPYSFDSLADVTRFRLLHPGLTVALRNLRDSTAKIDQVGPITRIYVYSNVCTVPS